METAGIILAVTPLIRMVFEAFGLLKKETKTHEKVKKATQLASAAGIGMVTASLV